MKRNIIGTITFSSGAVNLTVLEKLSTNLVEIFNASGDVKTVNTFLSSSLKEVENLIGAKLTNVGVVVEPSKMVDAKIDLFRQAIAISGDTVSQVDIDNVVQLTKEKYPMDANRRVILVQPIKYDVQDLMTKSYSEAPIHKKGNTLTVSSTVTSISLQAYDFIMQVTKSLSLDISQILLSPQSISQNHLSDNALSSGAVLIHISENQSFVTINKNRATVASMSIYDFGFKNLVNGIVKTLGCSPKEARDIIAAHGSFDEQTKRVIYTNQTGLKELVFTSGELAKLITMFMTQLLAVIRKFLQQKGVSNLPIVISGKVWKIDQIESFVRNFMLESHVSIYNPMSFIETNDKNINALGLIKFMDIMDKVMGRVYNTIIETNPNSLALLKAQHQNSKGWFAKVITKIGGHYDWN